MSRRPLILDILPRAGAADVRPEVSAIVTDPPALLVPGADGHVEVPLEHDPDTDVSRMAEGEVRRLDDLRIMRIEGAAWRGFPPGPVAARLSERTPGRPSGRPVSPS